jgi:homoaconitase/3-isopropylmalate dehydratase large subunit
MRGFPGGFSPVCRPPPRTLYDKIFDDHVVDRQDDGTCLLYIDRHLVHEVTSPQAFEGLRMSGRKVRHPEKTLAVVDHNVPTSPERKFGIKNEESRIQVEALAENASRFRHRILFRERPARASSTSSARSRASRCPA